MSFISVFGVIFIFPNKPLKDQRKLNLPKCKKVPLPYLQKRMSSNKGLCISKT